MQDVDLEIQGMLLKGAKDVHEFAKKHGTRPIEQAYQAVAKQELGFTWRSFEDGMRFLVGHEGERLLTGVARFPELFDAVRELTEDSDLSETLDQIAVWLSRYGRSCFLAWMEDEFGKNCAFRWSVAHLFDEDGDTVAYRLLFHTFDGQVTVTLPHGSAMGLVSTIWCDDDEE